jgi:hypothetical protein
MPLPIPTSRSEIAALQRERKVAVVNALRAPFHQRRLKASIQIPWLMQSDGERFR